MVLKTKSDAKVWIGRGMTVLAALPFCFSSIMKFTGGPQMLEGWTHFGWPASLLTTVGVLELVCVMLYLIPQVAVLGAILLTGYLGGALSTHLRVGESIVIHVILGILIWGGLYLRDSRLREILPIRR